MRHGTTGSYQGGCRCADCRRANARACREHILRRIARRVCTMCRAEARPGRTKCFVHLLSETKRTRAYYRRRRVAQR